MGDVTVLLHRLRDGEEAAGAELFQMAYGQLHGLAQAMFRSQKKSHTLQPTAVVHEAYLKMVKPGKEAAWQDRVHFFAVAARAMRQVLVNHARDAGAQKRGGDLAGHRVTMSGVDAGAPDLDVVAVHEALERLAELSPRQGRLAELRFFGGLNNKEIAEALGVSLRSVELDWKMAKVHLQEALGDG